MIGEVISSDYDISENLISFFADIVPNLKRIQNEALKLLLKMKLKIQLKKCNKQIQK